MLHEVDLPEGPQDEATESLGLFYVAVDGGRSRLARRSSGEARG
ncbi:hypothetical protein [Kitasatospora camelliae]|uniref:Uncharacterized protein n=1 Tax=Kitasatospora camelliae TaxID=3156397 RepID=A0AAU8K6A7_9ACTN